MNPIRAGLFGLILLLLVGPPAQASLPSTADARAEAAAARAEAEAARAEAEADHAESRAELEAARREVERARQELERAAEALARTYAEQAGGDSPRSFVYRAATDPDAAVLGVTIGDAARSGKGWHGVRITAVTPGSGAADAGLRSGDLIVEADGKRLEAKSDEDPAPYRMLKDILKPLKAGDTLKLAYERDGKRQTTEAELRRPQVDAWNLIVGGDGMHWFDDHDFGMVLPAPPAPPPVPAVPSPDGVPPAPPAPVAPLAPLAPLAMFGGEWQLARLDDDLAEYFGTDEGVLVISVPTRDQLGLKGGDILLRVAGEPVDDPVDALRALYSAAPKGKPIEVEILRHKRRQTLTGRVSTSALDLNPAPQLALRMRAEAR